MVLYVCAISEGSGDIMLKCRRSSKVECAGPFLYKAAIFLWQVVVVLLFQMKTNCLSLLFSNIVGSLYF